MKDSQTKRILGFYDEHAEYVRNDRYSDSSQTVYTRPEDKYHWLVAKPMGKNRLEVHQTDEHGVITARDTYESQRNTFQCVDVERLQADGKHRYISARMKSIWCISMGMVARLICLPCCTRYSRG
ncbi:hypothetical protein [Clostridium butyricum]|uniref:hypothetical protein n=1 Tax=Clostridium butyricum TaxID=1492 RepID=UPI0015E33734|nr:hypothetical protein [Clostridium butyricum]